jgi:hypothetical protein
MLIEDLVITVLLATRASRRPYAAIRFERSYTGGARLLWKEMNILSAITGAKVISIVSTKKGTPSKALVV